MAESIKTELDTINERGDTVAKATDSQRGDGIANMAATALETLLIVQKSADDDAQTAVSKVYGNDIDFTALKLAISAARFLSSAKAKKPQGGTGQRINDVMSIVSDSGTVTDLEFIRAARVVLDNDNSRKDAAKELKAEEATASKLKVDKLKDTMADSNLPMDERAAAFIAGETIKSDKVTKAANAKLDKATDALFLAIVKAADAGLSAEEMHAAISTHFENK